MRRYSGGLIKTACFLLLVAVVLPAFGESTLNEMVGGPVRILTVGRESYQGTLYAVLEDRIELIVADGRIIQILRTEIEEYSAIDPTAGKRALFQDAATNRLMVMPTAFPMERGEFHVTDQEIAVVTGSYGLTNNISLWAGISVPGLLVSGRFSFYLAPTVGMTIGAFTGVEWFEGRALVLPYTIMSFGSPNRNLSVGGAAVYTFGDSGLDGAVGVIGGKIVLTPTTALVTENWAMWDFSQNVPWPSFNVIGLSFRIAGTRLSWDIGAVVVLTVLKSDETGKYVLGGIADETVIPLPLISLTYRID